MQCQTIFQFDTVKLLWHNLYDVKRYINKGKMQKLINIWDAKI